jgi:dipeptidyl aminopeptidase/acylaminoacyl peptidase
VTNCFWLLVVLSAPIALAPNENETSTAPTGNLTTEGVPSAPIELIDEIRPYTEFRAAGICSWHPISRQMLIYTQLANTPQIHHLDFPGGARTQLTFLKDAVWDASYEPTDGHYFVYSKDSGGDENYQKYRFDVETGASTLLTDGKSRNTDGIWSHSRHLYAYGSTRRTGKDVDLWGIDPENPKSNRLLAQLAGGGWTPLDFSPDDRQVLLLERISENDVHLWTAELPSGEKTLITPDDAAVSVSYGGGQFSADGAKVYVTCDRDSEFKRLGTIDLATKKLDYITGDLEWDINDFRLSWDGKLVVYVTNESGRDVLHVLDTATRQELPQPSIPVGMISNLQWHKNNQEVGFNFIDSHRGCDVYSADVRNNKVDRWTFSETGGIHTDQIPAPEPVRWKSFDDRTISGWLHKPPKKFTGKRPVIIHIHGGPESQSRPWLSSGSCYFVNELGIALIQPNVRGSIGYGKTFCALDDGFKREDSYKDIGSLLDWIKARPDLDPDRIMVTGGSYGGHMTLAIATYYPDRIRCAVDLMGQSNLATFLDHTSGYRQDLRRVEYGDERDPKMREFLNRIAPLTNASKITKPLFIVQGSNDPRVPLSEAQQMVQTVRQNGTPVWFLTAKDEGHAFMKRPNEDQLLYATVMFIKQYLLSEK